MPVGLLQPGHEARPFVLHEGEDAWIDSLGAVFDDWSDFDS